jgi:hypothetical protein
MYAGPVSWVSNSACLYFLFWSARHPEGTLSRGLTFWDHVSEPQLKPRTRKWRSFALALFLQSS